MGGLGGIVCAVDGPWVDARAFAGVGLACVGEGLARGVDGGGGGGVAVVMVRGG